MKKTVGLTIIVIIAIIIILFSLTKNKNPYDLLKLEFGVDYEQMF